MGVHRFEEFLAVELRQEVGAEPVTEVSVEPFQLRPRKELSVGGELLVVLKNPSLYPVVKHRKWFPLIVSLPKSL